MDRTTFTMGFVVYVLQEYLGLHQKNGLSELAFPYMFTVVSAVAIFILTGRLLKHPEMQLANFRSKARPVLSDEAF